MGTQGRAPLKVAVVLSVLQEQECPGETKGYCSLPIEKRLAPGEQWALPLHVVMFCNMEGLLQHLLFISTILQATTPLKV